jgi:hypothetical protein
MTYPDASEHDRTEHLVEDVPLGHDVYSSDDDKLGVVKEVQGRSFKVAVNLQPDYWLSFDAVRGVEAGRVVVTFPKDDLRGYKMDDPQVL